MTRNYQNLQDKEAMFHTVFFSLFREQDFLSKEDLKDKLSKCSKKQVKKSLDRIEECLKYPNNSFTNEDLKMLKTRDIFVVFDLLYPAYIDFPKLEEETTMLNKNILISAGLSSNAVDDLLYLFSSYLDFNSNVIDNNLHLKVMDTSAYTVTAIFKNIEFIKNKFEDKGIVNNFKLSKKDNKYLFEIDYEILKEDDQTKEINIVFCCDGIKEQVEFYNYSECQTSFYNENYLKSKLLNMVISILTKQLHFKEYLTQKEQDILPLCYVFIDKLYPNLFEDTDVAVLEKEGLKKLRKLCVDVKDDAFEQIIRKQEKKKKINIDYLINTLFLIEHKKLTTLILDMLYDCANEFESKVKKQVDQKIREKAQQEITKTVHRFGYDGEFPHFKKMGKLNGVRNIVEDFDVRTVAFEKHMGSLIDCVELVDTGFYNINLICGTIFFKKDEVNDFANFTALDACFSNKGRTATKVIKCPGDEMFNHDDYLRNMFQYLPDTTVLAAKIACFEKLDQRDKLLQKLQAKTVYSKQFILGFMLLASLFFGLAMFLLFCLLELIFNIIFTNNFIEAFKLFTDTSKFLFYICMGGGLAFGITMGIFQAIGSKK